MLIVGIDTGIHTGLAVWDTSRRQFREILTTGIVEAMRYLHDLQQTDGIGLLVFEDARKRKWIPHERDIKQVKGRAMGAGSVKRDCSIWEEWCDVYRVDHIAVPPKNNRTKLSAGQFNGITGYDRRTSEHGRDAAMLVFGR